MTQDSLKYHGNEGIPDMKTIIAEDYAKQIEQLCLNIQELSGEPENGINPLDDTLRNTNLAFALETLHQALSDQGVNPKTLEEHVYAIEKIKVQQELRKNRGHFDLILAKYTGLIDFKPLFVDQTYVAIRGLQTMLSFDDFMLALATKLKSSTNEDQESLIRVLPAIAYLFDKKTGNMDNLPNFISLLNIDKVIDIIGQITNEHGAIKQEVKWNNHYSNIVLEYISVIDDKTAFVINNIQGETLKSIRNLFNESQGVIFKKFINSFDGEELDWVAYMIENTQSNFLRILSLSNDHPFIVDTLKEIIKYPNNQIIYHLIDAATNKQRRSRVVDYVTTLQGQIDGNTSNDIDPKHYLEHYLKEMTYKSPPETTLRLKLSSKLHNK